MLMRIAATPLLTRPAFGARNDGHLLRMTAGVMDLMVFSGTEAVEEEVMAACDAMMQTARQLEPTNRGAGVRCVRMLDEEGIYGRDILTFYRNVCGGDAIKATAALYASRLKLIDAQALDMAIQNPAAQALDFDKILLDVSTVYPELKKYVDG